MELHDVTFFAKENEGPICDASVEKISRWPVTLKIDKDLANWGLITIHTTHRNWINFKNSVLNADRKVSEIFSGGGK